MTAPVGDLTVQGDRGTFLVKNLIQDFDKDSFSISGDVGYACIRDVATFVMGHVAKVFGVKPVHSAEHESREGGYIVDFTPPIPDDRWAEYVTFLGQTL